MFFDDVIQAAGDVHKAARSWLGMTKTLDARVHARAIEDGLWCVWPFGLGPLKRTVGLRITPGLPATEWPGVSAIRHHAETLSTTPRTYVPMGVYLCSIHGLDTFDILRDGWHNVSSDLVAFHQVLGGEGDLQRLHELIFDDRAQAANQLGGNPLPPFLASADRILRGLDRDPRHVHARSTIHTSIEGRPIKPAFDVQGPWSTAAAAAAFRLVFWDRMPSDSNAAQYAWHLLTRAPQFDTNVSQSHGHRASPAGGLADRILMRAASFLRTSTADGVSEMQANPFWNAAIRAGRKDAAVGYMEAAAALDGQGDGEQAWAALCAAAYWSKLKQGRCIPEIFRAARDLCEAYEWQDASAALDRLAD